jgi:hypothetical protein
VLGFSESLNLLKSPKLKKKLENTKKYFKENLDTWKNNMKNCYLRNNL